VALPMVGNKFFLPTNGRAQAAYPNETRYTPQSGGRPPLGRPRHRIGKSECRTIEEAAEFAPREGFCNDG